MKNFTLKLFTLCMFLLMGTIVMAQTQYAITFQVDMTNADPFDPTTDDVYMSGTFADWTQPGMDVAFKMEPVEVGSMFYTLTATIDSGEVMYKYFRVIDGAASWDNGEWTGDPNRKIFITGDATYENIWADKPMEIVFNVDMTDADPFDPTTDDVYIGGSLANGWAQPGSVGAYMLTPTDDNEFIYTITLLLNAGDHMYKYFRIINGEPSWDNGEWSGDPNRELTTDTLALVVDDVWALIDAGIPSVNQPFSYSMYPNPVNSLLNFSGINDVTKIDIFDLTGKLIRTINLEYTKEISINVNDFQSGVYFVKVYNNSGVQATKFIKN